MLNKYLSLLLILSISLSSRAQDIAYQIDKIRVKHHVPELAFAVFTADKIITEQYLGYHKLNDTDPADRANAQDYFHLGSNTKAITGFIAAYMVEQHKISWNTRYFDLFPEARALSNKAYLQITLQNLLSHRAKIQPFTTGKEFKVAPAFKGSIQSSRQQFAFYMLKQKPVISKESYTYSNAGFTVAATMLEKASGKSWEQLVDEVMNKKLGLHVKFGWPNKTDNKQPWGHWEENGRLEAVPGNTNYDLKYIEPAGDISMTLPYYIKFIKLNLQGLAGKGDLLFPATYSFLHYGLKDYAIGWANDLSRGQKLSEHVGSAGTFIIHTIIDGNKNMAYLVIVNSANEDSEDAIDETLTILKKLH